jgi:hypothetical protein
MLGKGVRGYREQKGEGKKVNRRLFFEFIRDGVLWRRS